MKTNAVTPVVLGLLSLGPRSGYDIKTVVDRSTRFFWAASYGQIYPELRRLEKEGLIEGEDAPRGERGRRVYEITKALFSDATQKALAAGHAKGKFIKCPTKPAAPKRCKDAKGKFAKCGTPGAKWRRHCSRRRRRRSDSRR